MILKIYHTDDIFINSVLTSTNKITTIISVLYLFLGGKEKWNQKKFIKKVIKK